MLGYGVTGLLPVFAKRSQQVPCSQITVRPVAPEKELKRSSLGARSRVGWCRDGPL